jgi:ABC-type transport system substrate-binding protein
MNRLELQALMQAPSDTVMTHPFTGKPATVAEVLKAIMRGEGAAVHPIAPQPGQPGYSPGPNITISQEAVNALPEEQYQELKQTGYIQGLTSSDNGRAFVHVSKGGSHSTSFTLDETGKVGPGRPMDLRDFQDPSTVK